jgi:hypothetical protein
VNPIEAVASSAPTDEQLITLLGRWGAKPIDTAGLIADLRRMFDESAVNSDEQGRRQS